MKVRSSLEHAYLLMYTTSILLKVFQILKLKMWVHLYNSFQKGFHLERYINLFNIFQKYLSNRKLFSCVCIAWYKHSRGWENSRQLCKPSTSSRVCITVENSPNPSSVYIRLCKHRKKVFCCFYKITSSKNYGKR